MTANLNVGSDRQSRVSTATAQGDETVVCLDSPLAGTTCHAACRTVIDVDDEDEDEVVCLDDYVTEEEFQRLINASQIRERESTPNGPRRNERPTHPWAELDTYDFKGMIIKPGKTVELEDQDFLRVTAIIRNLTSGEVKLRGWRLRSNKSMNGMLNKKRNEVCMILQLDEDDPRDPLVQGAEEVSLKEVQRIRRLVITNAEFPAQSFRQTERTGDRTPDNVVFNECHLVCRWQYITYYRTAKDRLKLINTEQLVVKIKQGDDGVDSSVSEEKLRFRWRELTIKGGAGCLKNSEKEVIDLTDQPSSAWSRKRRRPDTPEGLNTMELDGGSDAPIDLTPDAPNSPCPTPSTEAKRGSNLDGNRPKPMTSKQTVSVDITMDKLPNVTIDLTATDESQEENPVGLACEVKASFTTEYEGPRSRTQCNGNISTWRSLETPSKKQRREVIQCPTPPSSCGSSRVEVRGSRGEDPNRRSVYITPSSNRSPSRKRPFNDRPIPFRLKHAQKGGKLVTLTPDIIEIPSEQVDLITEIRPNSTYSLGDCFCGAGGMSCAAHSAGYDVAWAFDHDYAAITSYGLNHGGTQRHLIEADQFVFIEGENLKVDVMHLSPPCQFFSPAHTMQGQNDERNTAAQFAVPELIKKCRPRIVTLEQTFGLFQRHRYWFNHMIQFFTDLGFSIRWKVVNFAEYGLPQARKRLIIFASW